MIPYFSIVSWQTLAVRMSYLSVCVASEIVQLIPVSPLERYSDCFCIEYTHKGQWPTRTSPFKEMSSHGVSPFTAI